jgi:DNA-binding response OmpR family regulator
MRRILVVDDEPVLRELYRRELEDEGFEVATAGDSAAAMRVVETWNPRLVVLDVKLGNENGLDLLRRVVEMRRGVATILLSAYPGYKDDFSSWLADAFVTKSGDTTELKNTIQEVLGAGAWR